MLKLFKLLDRSNFSNSLHLADLPHFINVIKRFKHSIKKSVPAISLLLALQPFNQAWSNSLVTIKPDSSVNIKTDTKSDIKSAPQRIISLAPHVTEMLFSAGAGDKIVGVVAYSDFPPAALGIEKIGSYNAINLEKIILLNPDLIIAWKGGNGLKDVEKLQQLGFKIAYSDPYQLTDIPQEIRDFGELLQTQATANAVAEGLENTLHSLKSRYHAKTKVTAFYQIWNAPMMTINGKQSISQALNLCGATNIFTDLPVISAEVSIESVIERNPDTILLGGLKQMQQDWLASWQKWPTIQAVHRQQIHLLDADTFQRPTQRFIEGIEGLCQLLDLVRSDKLDAKMSD